MESAETVQMIVQPCRMNANMENERPRRVLHKGYVLSFNGIFKIFQATFAFLTFILSATSPWNVGGWINFVGVVSFVNAVIWYVFYLFNTVPPIFINYFVELIAYGVLTFFLFIAGCVGLPWVAESAHYLFAVIFCFVCFAAYLTDTVKQVIQVRKRWKERNERRVPIPTQEPANI